MTLTITNPRNNLEGVVDLNNNYWRPALTVQLGQEEGGGFDLDSDMSSFDTESGAKSAGG